MNRRLLTSALALAASTFAFGQAEAATMVSGTVDGPLGGFNTDFRFTNLAGSTASIKRIILNGATAVLQNLVWDSASPNTVPAGSTVTISGEDTAVLQFDFSGTGFGAGKVFDVGTDPDIVGNGSYGATVGDLIGTGVRFSFSDNTVQHYKFVAAGGAAQGLTLGAVTGAVPEPATWAMMLVGFAAAGLAMRARRRTTVRFAL